MELQLRLLGMKHCDVLREHRVDGLRRVLSEQAIEKVVCDEALSPEEIVKTLVDRTLAGGSPDNVTVVLVRGGPGVHFADDRGHDRSVGGSASQTRR